MGRVSLRDDLIWRLDAWVRLTGSYGLTGLVPEGFATPYNDFSSHGSYCTGNARRVGCGWRLETDEHARALGSVAAPTALTEQEAGTDKFAARPNIRLQEPLHQESTLRAQHYIAIACWESEGWESEGA